MADSSFDIVSKIDRQEVDNALSQAARELAQRYVFKGTGAEIKWSGEQAIEISANADDRASAVLAGNCVSERQDCVGQLQVAGVQLRRLAADVFQRSLQLNPARLAVTGDETGGVVFGVDHQLVVTQVRGDIGRAFHGVDQRGADGIDGAGEAASRDRTGDQAGSRSNGQQVLVHRLLQAGVALRRQVL